MQQVNLVDARLLPPPLMLSATRLLALAALSTAVMAWHGHDERTRLDAALAASVSEPEPAAHDGLDGQPLAAGADHALEASIAQRRALRELLARADDRPADAQALLQAVIASLPPTVWLTEIDVRGRRALRIAGGTLDPLALRTLAARLQRIEPLRGLALEVLRLSPEEVDESVSPRPPRSHRFELASADYMARGGDEP